MSDGDRLLELSRRAQGLLEEDSSMRQRIAPASELLGQLLLQDVERTEDGVCLKEGVSRDRMVSVHDPEMRHGHKSSSRRFDGHKASVAVDTDSQVITAVDVLSPATLPTTSVHWRWWSAARRVRSQWLRRPLETWPMAMAVHVSHLPTPVAH